MSDSVCLSKQRNTPPLRYMKPQTTRSSFWKAQTAKSLVLFIVPTPLEGGGTIYSNGFFCSDNFGRSIYSSYRIGSGIIKKLKRVFQFLLWILEVFQQFYSHFWPNFRQFWPIFSSILAKYVAIVNCSVIDFISKERGGLLNCSIWVYC